MSYSRAFLAASSSGHWCTLMATEVVRRIKKGQQMGDEGHRLNPATQFYPLLA
jgi:hypothetical protein